VRPDPTATLGALVQKKAEARDERARPAAGGEDAPSAPSELAEAQRAAPLDAKRHAGATPTGAAPTTTEANPPAKTAGADDPPGSLAEQLLARKKKRR
jgi:hypothetical protein